MMNFRRVFDGVMLAPLCTTNGKLTCVTSTPPQTQPIATNAHPHIHTNPDQPPAETQSGLSYFKAKNYPI